MKRRFDFRLARLARVRIVEERVLRAEWQKAESELRLAEERLDHARALVANGRADVRRAMADATPPGRLHVLLTTLDVLSDAVTRCMEARDEARARSEEAAETWRAKEAERRGLAKLEEKGREHHRREVERTDASELDESALQRAATRGREWNSSSSGPSADRGGFENR